MTSAASEMSRRHPSLEIRCQFILTIFFFVICTPGACIIKLFTTIVNWRYDTQLNDIHHIGLISDFQHNDSEHNGTECNDTQHNNTAILLNVAFYCYAECRYAAAPVK